jgi:hypothetical protein
MSFTRDDHKSLLARRSSQQDDERARHNVEAVARAQVAMEALTGDANWDLFLSYVQAAIDETDRAIEAVKAALISPQLADPLLIMTAKLRAVELTSRAATLRTVIDLPKEIATLGNKARAILVRMEANKDGAAAA